MAFTKEISLMMFGFGDTITPNPDTVEMVENITLGQLRVIVKEALKYSDGITLNGEELIFLMRHNKYKMRRFVKYLQNKKLKKINPSSNYATGIHEMIFDLEEKPKENLENQNLMQFIEMIDETGEFTDLTEMDQVKYERDLRADRISQTLDAQHYLEFCKARSVSFNSKKTLSNLDRMKAWIDPDPKTQIKFSKEALEVLAYFAYQTVAEIIDCAFLVRMDAKWSPDQFNQLGGPYYTATMFNCAAKFGEVNYDFNKICSGQTPLTVSEIKEVMRRVHSPQGGSLNFGGRRPETHFCFAI